MVASDEIDEKISFRGDKYSAHLASEFRSVLNELYSLRDAMLAVGYRLAHGQADPFTMKKVKQIVTAGTSPFDKLVANSMFASDGGGRIERMSLYRSLALHCLGATNPVCGDVYKIARSPGPFGRLNYIVFPLYDDVEKMREIEQGSSKGALERPSHEETLRFFQLPKHLDALEFTFDCFRELLLMCEALASEVQIQPQIMTLTDKDILSGTFTDEHGKTTRFRKNAEGQLEDY
jgi:hypothetical protein